MSTPAEASASSSLLRVEKGQADPEELAAITAVLLARAASQPDAVPTHRGRSAAGWRRLERQSGFRTAHSWQG
ncbi:acyl-CoA carboxylase subunit epsilon [Streptomyces sp. NBC_01210]|uniref:acyl-CoA carboxylase subunit epsilon n=1 Tax=Streptomyces sp. NBC_01210 TaxID=2903774 RepID=UPI002E15D60D|nr:acyl-CoA carboxylase subunit epsilon [Streptomyces sp. NBC_01210]